MMFTRILFFVVPLVFAAESVAYFIYKVRKYKKASTFEVQQTGDIKTVEDYHKIRDALKYP